MEAIKIVAFSTLAAIVYGVLHDQVTAHLCVEYFTLAHPPVFPTDSPFLLALGWGVIATWWVGLTLGLLLAAAARWGSAHMIEFRQLRWSIGALMLASGMAALIAGIAGGALAATQLVDVPGGWESVIPTTRWTRFTAVAYAHLSSYGVGIVGGLFLIVRTIRSRVRSSG